VGDNTEQWLSDLRSAMEHVERVRAKGPSSAAQPDDVAPDEAPDDVPPDGDGQVAAE